MLRIYFVIFFLNRIYQNLLIIDSKIVIFICIFKTASIHINQIIQQLSGSAIPSTSTTSTLTTSAPSFEFNKPDLDKIRSFLISTTLTTAIPTIIAPQIPLSTIQSTDSSITSESTLVVQPPISTSTSETGENTNVEKMDTIVDTVPSLPVLPSISTSNKLVNPFQPVVSYSKLLRPLFNCSSKLGRSLCELFGLLVKLSAGSWKNTNTRLVVFFKLFFYIKKENKKNLNLNFILNGTYFNLNQDEMLCLIWRQITIAPLRQL